MPAPAATACTRMEGVQGYNACGCPGVKLLVFQDLISPAAAAAERSCREARKRATTVPGATSTSGTRRRAKVQPLGFIV